MKKIIIIIAIFGLLTAVSADDISDAMKKECQYIVYGNGKSNGEALAYISGIIQGQGYAIDPKNITEYRRKALDGMVADRSCKEALNNNDTTSFQDKFSYSVFILLHKGHEAKLTTK